MSIQPDLSGPLKALRLERGLSVEAMAERIKVSRTALYRYERGEAPKLATLQRAASLLGVPLATFMGSGVEWFGTALGFFERLRQIEAQADHIFALFGPASWLLVSDAYAEFVVTLIRAALRSARDADELVDVMRARREAYGRRRPSVVSLLSLHDMQPADAAPSTAHRTAADIAKARALHRAEWSHVAAVAEAPPRGVQVGVLRDRIPTTGFSLARGSRGTTVAISPFRFGEPMNLSIGAAAVTQEAQAVRIHETMADELWSAASKGAEAGALLRARLRRRRPRAP
jgi:transcriptional regulator with XRE-family HTH domain